MARIKWKNPNDQLRGTFGGAVYRVKGGTQYVHVVPLPYLPKRPTLAQIESYTRKRVVQDAIARIQLYEQEQGAQTVKRMQEIADKYPAIKKAVERMYDDFKDYFPGRPNDLQKAIIYWYCNKRLPPKLDLFREELPEEYR